MNRREVTIVGGGPAGLTLGIALRQGGVPVRVCEAGRYPRHRVCGEFISGRGLEVLARLELLKMLERRGARRAETVAFFAPEGESLGHALPQEALCVSRFALEQTLAEEFRRLGGRLFEGALWRETMCAEGVVRATGRRVQGGSDARSWRWFGLKAHTREAALLADLEMHVQPHGYVGVCRVEDGIVNVCGLFRRRAGDETGAVRDWLRGLPGTPLRERLGRAAFAPDTFCAVAGLGWTASGLRAGDELCVGDALAVIPPVTGNGLSLAFESAALVAEPLTAWSAGRLRWDEARQTAQRACRRAFAARLRWAGWLQRGLFTPWTRRGLMWAGRSGWVWERLFWRTRCGAK